MKKKMGYWSFVMGIKLYSLIDKHVNNLGLKL